MFPAIAPGYAIRGTQQEQYLANSRKFALVPLEHDSLASIIQKCDGRNSLASLAKLYRTTVNEMQHFLEKFKIANVLTFTSKPSHRNITVALGPRAPWLREVHVDITGQCNQAHRCRHCFRGDKLNRRIDRDTNEWLILLDDLSRMGVYNIALSGGEPLLRRDLPQIVRAIIDHEMFLGAIFTNGSIWSRTTEKVIATLTERNVGTTFYVSLDGPTAETHDANRGAGAFAKTVDFITRLVRIRAATNSPLKIAVNSQINSGNVNLLLPWYQFILKSGVDRWRLTSGRVTGRLANNPCLLPQWDRLFAIYARLIQRYIADRKAGVPLRLNVEGFFNARMLDERVAFTFTKETPICDYKEHACSIEPNGDVQFCTSWGDRRFGNVFRLGIRAIWHGAELQSLKAMKIGEIDECGDCDLLEFCGGGCRLVADGLKRRDPYSCERYRRFKKCIFPLLRAESVKFTNEREEL